MGSNLQNTPVVVFLRLLGDLLTVNILAILCSIPVVTIGASLSAMYAVVIERERQDGTVEVIKTFFHYFVQNLLPATILELIVALVAVVSWTDTRFASAAVPPIRTLYVVVGVVIALADLIVFILGFAQQSIYKNTIGNYIKNSFYLAFCAPGRLLLSVAAWILPWALMIWQPEVFLIRFGVVYMLWGFSFPAWAVARAFNGIFQKTEQNSES